MPTLSSSVIPIPASWDEFEEICLTSLKIRWTSPNLSRNGRQGQTQAGVDIYGEDDLGRFVGVQCKLTTGELKIGTIKDEISKAETFVPMLNCYYVATTSLPDATLQKGVRILSQERVNSGKFPVGILFWSDLIRDLTTNEAEFKKHFPQFNLKEDRVSNSGARLLSSIDIAYLGLNLKYYMALIFGEMGLAVGEDPMQIETLCMTIEACSLVLWESTKATEMIQIINKFRDYVSPYVIGQARPEGWKPANQMATSIESRINSLEYSLVGLELGAFKVGQILGKWSDVETSNGNFNALAEKRLLEYIGQICPNQQVPSEVLDKLAEYKSSDSIANIHIPHKIYNVVRNILVNYEIQENIA
jgi:hypothetical protein